MQETASSLRQNKERLCALEADMAFFEARLSLAGEAPDTAYQRAQIKTYQTLGSLFGDTIKTLRPPKAPRADTKARAEPPVTEAS
jgi:hypothetical protein